MKKKPLGQYLAGRGRVGFGGSRTEKAKTLDPQKGRKKEKAKDSWPRVGQNNQNNSHIDKFCNLGMGGAEVVTSYDEVTHGYARVIHRKWFV